jgi:hypothetical protein
LGQFDDSMFLLNQEKRNFKGLHETLLLNRTGLQTRFLFRFERN